MSSPMWIGALENGRWIVREANPAAWSEREIEVDVGGIKFRMRVAVPIAPRSR